MKNLESDRLHYIPLTQEHLEQLFDLDSDPEVIKFFNRPIATRETAQKSLLRYISYATLHPGAGCFALYTKSTNEFIGIGVLVHIELKVETNKIEVGYRLHKKFWGQGYAQEVATRLIDYGFNQLNLSEIYGTTHYDHVVSQAVLRKVGLQYLGTASYHGGCSMFKIDNPQKTVRLASVHEIDQLAHLFDEYRQFYGRTTDLLSCKIFLLERIKHHESVIFVTSDQSSPQKLNGFTQLYPSFSSLNMKPQWILNDLFVEPNARGQKHGEALIQIATDFAQSQKACGLALMTAITNVPAQKLYEKMKWVKDEKFLTYTLQF